MTTDSSISSFFVWAVTADGQSAVTPVTVEPEPKGRRLAFACVAQNLNPIYPGGTNPNYRGFRNAAGKVQMFPSATMITTLRSMFSVP